VAALGIRGLTRGYNPRGDLCPHGRKTAYGELCDDCAHAGPQADVNQV